MEFINGDVLSLLDDPFDALSGLLPPNASGLKAHILATVSRRKRITTITLYQVFLKENVR